MKSRWTCNPRDVSQSVNREGPPDAVLSRAASGGPSSSAAALAIPAETRTLADLPIGAHLILRCRKDWRDATLIAINLEEATLSVGSPTGRTYRLRRSLASPLSFDGPIPILGTGSWRAGRARYDSRW